MGGVAKAINPSNILRGIGAAATMGTSELLQKRPFGLINNPTGLGILGGGGGEQNPYISGPFGLDPNQMAANKAAIEGEGQKQYQQTLGGIGEYGTAATQRAKDLFGQMLPNIAENAQAAHLYDSTGYGQEVARQQGNIASQIAEQEAQQKMGALQGLQGFQTGALQRGLSMQDFINQANVAKTIGAQMAPPPPSSKAQAGTVLQGVGAVSPWFARGGALGKA